MGKSVSRVFAVSLNTGGKILSKVDLAMIRNKNITPTPDQFVSPSMDTRETREHTEYHSEKTYSNTLTQTSIEDHLVYTL